MVRVFGFLIKSSISFRLQQVFFSYGLLLGVGVGCVVDTATLMVGQVLYLYLYYIAFCQTHPLFSMFPTNYLINFFQYFKRRREAVEIGVGAAGGLGLAIMFLFVEGSVRSVDGDDDDDGDDGDGDDFVSNLMMGLGLAIIVLFVGSVRSVGIILNCVCYI